MSNLWTIKGEAGKTVNATARTLEELHAQGLQVAFRSLAADELTWDVWLQSNAEISTLVPDEGQRISLYLNGDRYFTGHVTGREPAYSAGQWGYSITVSGPWWWLENSPLTSQIPDETTVVRERAVYVLNTGSPAVHLVSLVSRAIELGLPVALGSFATCAACPRISLREMSIAEAISEVMRLVADGHVYFDHSGPDGTYPQLCMQRRTPATSLTITPSVVTTPTLRLRPRHELKVSELTVNYASRETYENQRVNGYQNQTAGTSDGSRPDRQIITVSGPEPGLGLPQDLTDFVVVGSANFFGNAGIAAALRTHHDLLKAGGVDSYGWNVYDTSFVDVARLNNVVITTNWPQKPLLIVTDAEGNDLDLSEWSYYLTQGQPRDWWKKDGIESIQARVTATVASDFLTLSNEGPEDPGWAKILGAKRTYHYAPMGNSVGWRYVWQATVSCTIPLVKKALSGTLIRQEDWGWFNPPAGFAEYLLETQNWVPWEGQVGIASDDSPPANAVGSVLNITGWVPEAASMRAMIAGYAVTPATGQVSFTLGPPARHSFRDLVNRYRQTGADNVYWLGAGGGLTPDLGADPAPAGTILSESGHYEINEDNTTYPTTEST